MEALFKISKINIYNLLVEGLEKDNSEYIDPVTGTPTAVRSYLYTDSITLNTLTSITSGGEETLIDSQVIDHTKYQVDSTEFVVKKDGLYGVSHIILPSQIWLDYIKNTDASVLNMYSIVYYYNTVTNKFYKDINGVSTEVQLSEILSADYTEPAVGEKGTTIIRADKNTFVMTYLNGCFNSICKSLLTSLPKSCNRNSLSSQIFNRDILWMAINVIKYCLDTSQLYEAQRYLEEVTRCSNWCDGSFNINLINSSGCGCNN